MPCDYKEYPINWKWLSKQVIHDAGNKCELCGAPNGISVVRPDKKDSSYPWYIAPNGYSGRRTKIILTVHHIDGDKKNNSKHNLIALCQKCHLRLDLSKHLKNKTASKHTPPLFQQLFCGR